MNSPLTIADAAAAMRSGSLTPLELTGECLERIGRLEPLVSAWVLVDERGALDAAEQRTSELRAGRSRGPLHGIPIGVKDIVDVEGMPTRAGSLLTDENPASLDATVVARLRAAGAIILGKTVTTQFAYIDPPPTKNPWNASCTPGGSSSGSAASLAVGMCLGAIGSQTGGSIIRPAAYCGVAGFKATLGRVSRAGVIPVSEHLDHVGTMARTAADCGLLLAVIAGPDPRDAACSEQPGIALAENSLADANRRPPRLGVWRDSFQTTAEPETAELIVRAIEQLREQGATVVELALPEHFDAVLAMHRRIMAHEAAVYHRAHYGAPRPGYAPKIAELIDEGLAVTITEYEEALRHQAAFRMAVNASLSEVDAAAIPATPAPAPADLSTTGDARFNAPWSHAGVPSITVPAAIAKSGLPVGLQLVGQAWSEVPLLETAVWCENRLGFRDRPLLAQ